MLGVADYLLKAENYATAARGAVDDDERMRFIRASAICRNKALRIQLGKRADVLRRCPFTRDQIARF
jgi:hypothetical protein